MKGVYKIAQISKQAYHQYRARLNNRQDRTSFYIGLMEAARIMHPVIGLEKIYHLFNPQGIGRDAFCELGKMAGYSLEPKAKTSWKGARIIPYHNLLSDKQFNDVNQVWATDITYYKIKSKFYYISMIMDLYSRRIIAALASPSLHTKHSIRVLKLALKESSLKPGHQLIHHSDKGVQYTSNQYVQLLKKNKIAISMCNSVFENTNMERLNGIIKNDYLVHWNPQTFKQLQVLLARAKNNYNLCPHSELNMLSPILYEQQLFNVPLNQRTLFKAFTFKKSKNIGDPNQLQLFNSSLFVNQIGQHFSG